MINDILIVDSVQEAISWFGIEQFRDMILQEQGGSYFFVDIDEGCEKIGEINFNRKYCDLCFESKEDLDARCNIGDNKKCPCGFTEYPIKVDCGDCSRCIKPLPLKIAWFIIQAIRLQRQTFSLAIPPSNEEIEEIFKRLESQEDQL